MVKKLNFILLVLISISSFAQESVVFEAKFNPNKKYKNQLKTTSQIEVKLDANKILLDIMESQGAEFPIITKSETNMVSDIVTQDFDENGELPAVIQYEKMISTTTVNGKKTLDIKPESDIKILGKYDVENKFKVDTIVGEKVSKQVKYILKATLENVQQTINFPEKPMRIGESFTSEKPMSIPIKDGIDPISIIINTKYLLTEIIGDKAFFNVKQAIELDMDQGYLKVAANGTGTGKLEFDVKQNYLTKYNYELPMDMTIKLNEQMKMEMKSTTISEQNVMME